MSDKVLREVEQEELSDVVELVDDTGRTLKFYHIGTMEYKNEGFVFFQPAEEIEGTDEDDVIIFRIGGDEGNEEGELCNAWEQTRRCTNKEPQGRALCTLMRT